MFSIYSVFVLRRMGLLRIGRKLKHALLCALTSSHGLRLEICPKRIATSLPFRGPLLGRILGKGLLIKL